MSEAALHKTEQNHLGFTFHRTFSLVRSAVSQVIRVAQQADIEGLKKIDNKKISELTNLGTIYIEAMPRYAKGAGLLNEKNLLTILGKYVAQKDLHLDQNNTQWLLHYHLSAPQGPGPVFWNQVVSKFFYPGNVFSSEDVVEFIGNFIWQTENKVLSKRAVQSTATVLLGTYTKPEGLAGLRILETTDSGRFRVQTPKTPIVWAVAYALLDFWDAHYPSRIGVSLDSLQDSNFIKLFLMTKSDLDDVLQSMQEIHYVEVHRAAPPYQVVLLRQDREPILDRVYGSH